MPAGRKAANRNTEIMRWSCGRSAANLTSIEDQEREAGDCGPVFPDCDMEFPPAAGAGVRLARLYNKLRLQSVRVCASPWKHLTPDFELASGGRERWFSPRPSRAVRVVHESDNEPRNPLRPHPVVTYRVSISSQRRPQCPPARPFIQLCGSAGHFTRSAPPPPSPSRRGRRLTPLQAATATVDATASFALSLREPRRAQQDPRRTRVSGRLGRLDLRPGDGRGGKGTAKQWSFCNSLELYPTQASVTLEPLDQPGQLKAFARWTGWCRAGIKASIRLASCFLALYGRARPHQGRLLESGRRPGAAAGERQSFNLRLSNVGKLTKSSALSQADHHWDNCLLSSLSLTDQSDDSSSTPLPDALLCKEIPLLPPGDSTRLYFVYIRPGQEFGTATDANFFVDVHGERAQHRPAGAAAVGVSRQPIAAAVEAAGSPTGATRVFRVEAADLGQIEAVIFGLRWWAPEQQPSQQQPPGAQTLLATFPSGRWLESSLGDT
uniref:PLAT domain-containing protein n=1 Tax=Macrostomum lignano TaxID=282301 RepID=A0A1I8F9Q2_9PLAT